jgi:hypothetical protein
MFVQPAQKAVPAESIVVGDHVFRTHTAHDDLMLVVEEIGQDIHAGRKVYVWTARCTSLRVKGQAPRRSSSAT